MRKNISAIRKEYSRYRLDRSAVDPDPMVQFSIWMKEAFKAKIPDPNAMTLATADSSGKVSARMVLLRDSDEKGFIFYSNYESRKGKELDNNPMAALVFFWSELERQIRIEGRIEKPDRETSEKYFSERPRKSQISAWASPQSEEIKDRKTLEAWFEEQEKKFRDKEIPLPPHWGGYRLIPVSIEFWQGRRSRLHDRILYLRNKKTWDIKRLAP